MDNRLYLWNYERNTPLTRYDKLDHIIVSVGLVRPRRGVFKEFIQYLLVIATTVEIILVGVAFEDNDVQKRIQLKPTTFFVSADNIFVLKIVGSATGTYHSLTNHSPYSMITFFAEISLSCEIPRQTSLLC